MSTKKLIVGTTVYTLHTQMPDLQTTHNVSLLVQMANRCLPDDSTSMQSREYNYFVKYMKTIFGDYITKDKSTIKIKIEVFHPEVFNKNFDFLIEHIDTIRPEFFEHLEAWL